LKLVTYESNGVKRLGVMTQNNQVLDLNWAYTEQLASDGELTPQVVADALIPANMKSFLARGDKGIELAQKVQSFSEQKGQQFFSKKVFLERKEVKLCAPILDPGKIICLAHNYSNFLEENNLPIPPEPRIFSKYLNAICGPEDDIIKPKATNELGYEAEMAFVIGKPARNVKEEDAYEYIAGYTIFNDVSASDITTIDKQVLRGKTYDTFAPIGPYLVTKDEVPDPHKLDIKLWVNDKKLQDSNTDQVLYKTPKLVAFLSNVMTLEPGDIIATGTPPGIGKFASDPTYMWPGDVCKIEVEKLGVLENKIIDEGE